MNDNEIHNSKIISQEPNNRAALYTVNNNINILVRKEENHLNFDDSYLEIEFLVPDHAVALKTKGDNVK